jgi:hypothetical protein
MTDANEDKKVTDIAEARAKKAGLQAKPESTEATVSYLRPYLTEIIAGLSDEEKMQRLAENVFEDVLSQIPVAQQQTFVDILQAMVNENSPTPPAVSGKVVRLHKVPNADENWGQAASA